MADLITEELLNAIAHVESENNPSAIGDRGMRYPAYGAFQMRRPAYLDVIRLRPGLKQTPFEALQGNADLQRQFARTYLEILASDYGLSDLDRLLAGYNAGPTAVRQGRIPVSTHSYVRKVKARLGGR